MKDYVDVSLHFWRYKELLEEFPVTVTLLDWCCSLIDLYEVHIQSTDDSMSIGAAIQRLIVAR